MWSIMMYCHIIDKIDNIDMDECLLKQCNVTNLLDFEYILFVRIFSSNKGALGNLRLSIFSSKSWSDFVFHLGSKLLLD